MHSNNNEYFRHTVHHCILKPAFVAPTFHTAQDAHQCKGHNKTCYFFCRRPIHLHYSYCCLHFFPQRNGCKHRLIALLLTELSGLTENKFKLAEHMRLYKIWAGRLGFLHWFSGMEQDRWLRRGRYRQKD